MTDRLKAALQQLNADDLDEITRHAESLARARRGAAPDVPASNWTFNWVGALRDRLEQSGVEAQRAAIQAWADLARGKESAWEELKGPVPFIRLY